MCVFACVCVCAHAHATLCGRGAHVMLCMLRGRKKLAYVGTLIFIGTSVAAGIYARRFKFVRPYPYYARIHTMPVFVLRPYPYYARIRTMPVFVLRPYVLSIDRGAKH